MLKRAAILLFCLLMIFVATFGFVVGVVSVPTIYSYAAVNDDSIYVPLRDPSDLVIGFQSYCKSRDLTIEGSLSDAVTTFTTGAFNSACNELGINVSQLQAEIKAEYDSSGKPVKFLFNDTGVMAMNRIFAQFLQDNELEVGDTVEEQTLYSGEYFVDDNGNSCLVFVASVDYSNSHNMNNIVATGTPFIKDNYNYVVNLDIPLDTTTVLYSFVYRGTTYNYQVNKHRWYSVYQYGLVTPYDGYYGWQRDGENYFYTYNESYGAIYKGNNNKYYYGIAGSQNKWVGEISNAQPSSVVIFLTTNNTVINNNNYEGDTIINNEGDIITEPDPVPPGGTDPGWDIGGGGGTATDGNGNTWNIQFPDFELPDLNIDWSINGLGEKFPFSIPFDLVALVTVLNAEPQAPRFEGTVNFGFTTWNYDINLQQFDSVAQACRIAELLLLVVGLILITRSIIKG